MLIEIVVQWGEMDALGHVNNARFFSWFESARIGLFERIGVASGSGGGPLTIGPILATTTCDFLKPVVYPATVAVTVTVARVGESSIAMEYEVADAADRAVLYAKGTSVAVLIDYRTMKKVRVPDEIRAAITALSSSL